MKYYTPDLLARFGSENPVVASLALKELEQKADAYVKHLDLIRSKLPFRLIELLDRFYLHDARLVPPLIPWISAEGQPPFVFREEKGAFEDETGKSSTSAVMLHLDPTPREFLVLHYRFVKLAKCDYHAELNEGPVTPIEWLHDEIDLAVSSEGEIEFVHSILFTRGLELRLRFRDFDYAVLAPSDPVPAPKEMVAANG